MCSEKTTIYYPAENSAGYLRQKQHYSLHYLYLLPENKHLLHLSLRFQEIFTIIYSVMKCRARDRRVDSHIAMGAQSNMVLNAVLNPDQVRHS